MNKNALVLLICGLAISVAVLGYQLYEERKEPQGIEINMDSRGLTIEKK